jgi:predicted transcriptional regulator of viral defense system
MHDVGRPDIHGLETEAYEQHGYFTSAQARAHGVSSQLLNHHVRRGRYEPVRRGLHRLQGYPRSDHDAMREKWRAVGAAKAVLSHESALALLELSDAIPDAVHLLVPRRQRGLRRPSGVVLHTRPDDANVPTVWRDGLPLTAPARTLVDTFDQLQPEQAAMAVRQALRRGLLTKRQLTEEADRCGKATAVQAALGQQQVVPFPRTT